jgi:hypothetical protein
MNQTQMREEGAEKALNGKSKSSLTSSKLQFPSYIQSVQSLSKPLAHYAILFQFQLGSNS